VWGLTSASQAPSRSTFRPSAVHSYCRWVLASPINRARRTSARAFPCAMAPLCDGAFDARSARVPLPALRAPLTPPRRLERLERGLQIDRQRSRQRG